MGKLPYRIALLAKKYNKKCAVISGVIEGVSLGDRMVSLVDGEITSEEAQKNAAEILQRKAKFILQ